ncbi:MAG: shikimate kinase [Peptococcaceae bacterium]|nr:shikimate kinase [Peptococcaceae bacterium]
MKKNMILVGFMGTGKSSVGRRLAQRLQMDFYDTDEEMTKVTGLDLMTLYWKCGKIRFHSEEDLVLCKLLRKENCVIATGGTLELYEKRLQAMRASGMVICLKARPDMIQQRVARKQNRPLLRLGNRSDKMQQLYADVESWQQVADLVVDTTDKPFDEIVQIICDAWEREQHGVL